MKNKATGYVLYDAVQGYGYCVQVYRLGGKTGSVLTEEYRAGDSRHDSQTFGTGDLSLLELLRLARNTASDLKRQHGIKGKTERDQDILDEERETKRMALAGPVLWEISE